MHFASRSPLLLPHFSEARLSQLMKRCWLTVSWGPDFTQFPQLLPHVLFLSQDPSGWLLSMSPPRLLGSSRRPRWCEVTGWLCVCCSCAGQAGLWTPGRKTTQARAPPCLASGCSLGSVVSDSETPWTVAHQAHGISQARILEWVATSFSRVHTILKINLFLIGG